MKIEVYSCLCDACHGRGFDDNHVLCPKCNATGAVLIPEEKRTLQAAIDNYKHWAAGFRAAVRKLGA
jgi:DnaJ-class molecular chaperone